MSSWVDIIDTPCTPCSTPSAPGTTTNLVVTEEVTSTGRQVSFLNGSTLIRTIQLHDRRRVTHTAHGFGVVGAIVPLSPGVALGSYVRAQANSPLTVASHIAIIVSANAYDLLSPGFYNIPNSLVIGSQYGLSHTTVGGFLPIVSIPTTAFMQQCFRVESSTCLYINLQEAQMPL